MDRTILHCDCNGFYASVECILRPELKNVPMAVGGDPESRHGIILAKNELAKKYKIETAETIWQAKQKCPNLVIVPPNHDRYEQYSQKINLIYERYTDLVEPFGIDESWLDISGSMHLFGGSGKAVADELRRVVRDELGLTISVGVSFNKPYAKLGSDYKKPDATTVISHENYRSIVFPLPVTDLLYVGKSSALLLSRLNVRTIGDLAACDPDVLHRLLGKVGRQLYEYASGLDRAPVRSAYESSALKSIGNGTTFRRDLVSMEDMQVAVHSLCDSIAARMRRHNVKCKTIQVHLKDSGFKTISRQRTLSVPTFLTREISEHVLDIIRSEWSRTPVRTITITGTSLVPADDTKEQLSLFNTESNKKRERLEQLECTVDRLRNRFGKGAITTGSILNNDLGIKNERD